MYVEKYLREQPPFPHKETCLRAMKTIKALEEDLVVRARSKTLELLWRVERRVLGASEILIKGGSLARRIHGGRLWGTSEHESLGLLKRVCERLDLDFETLDSDVNVLLGEVEILPEEQPLMDVAAGKAELESLSPENMQLMREVAEEVLTFTL